MKFLYAAIALLFFQFSNANEYSFVKKFHFTQGRFKLDSGKGYKYIDSDSVTVFKGPGNQIFEIEAIKSKELTFYTLSVKKGESLALIINDFAIMSKTKDVRMLKEGWVEDINGDGFLDIVQREKTFIVGKEKRRPAAAEYKNDKLRVKVWNPETGSYIEKEKTDPLYKKALKKYNFKLYTLHENKVI